LLFGFFPWGWGSEVIVAFAQNPGDILVTEFTTILQFSALVTFLIASLLIGGIVANRVYNLEPISFSASKTKSDSLFYNSIRKLGGSDSSGFLLASGFKTYFRKAKNIAWIIYGVGLIVVMNIFISQPDDPESAFIMSLFLGPLLAAFVVSDISLQGKDNLLLYRQTPTRTRKYLRIKLYQYLLTILPIVLIVETTVNLLVPDITLEILLLNVVLTLLIAAAAITFTLGLFLVNPAFTDKSGEFMINIQICVFGVMISFFVLLIPLDQILWDLFAIADALYPVAVIYTALQWIMGITMLSLGARKLSNMDLLILDEVGFKKFPQNGIDDFFEVIRQRYESGSIILTTNRKFEDWEQLFGDKVMASAIIDRLVHHAYIIKITGDSYRVKNTAMMENK